MIDSQEKPRKRNPQNLDGDIDHIEKTASRHRALFQAYKKFGFTDDQALWLVGKNIEASIMSTSQILHGIMGKRDDKNKKKE